MSLVIPTTSSTYGDSTSTERTGLLRKHVLAQFRSDADLEWVGRLRAILATEEVKYINLREARLKLRRDRDLWNRIESGVAQATVVVIDPNPIETGIRLSLWRDKLTLQDVDERAIIDTCATAIIELTPVWPTSRTNSFMPFPGEPTARLGHSKTSPQRGSGCKSAEG